MRLRRRFSRSISIRASIVGENWLDRRKTKGNSANARNVRLDRRRTTVGCYRKPPPRSSLEQSAAQQRIPGRSYGTTISQARTSSLISYTGTWNRCCIRIWYAGTHGIYSPGTPDMHVSEEPLLLYMVHNASVHTEDGRRERDYKYLLHSSRSIIAQYAEFGSYVCISISAAAVSSKLKHARQKCERFVHSTGWMQTHH